MLRHMRLKVNEIFYSLQGEGHFTGTPAVFVRLSGCNLSCPFCDTQHQHGTQMTEEEIVVAISKYPARHIVITGGEPTMQLTDSLIDKLHAAGWFVQIETNGTLPVPKGIDWVTCSPKEGGEVVLDEVDELKLLFPSTFLLDSDASLSGTEGEGPSLPRAREHRLQPLDTGDEARNREIVEQTIQYLLAHPEWKLSLQTHKILNVR